MKKFSFGQTALLCLPVLFLVVVGGSVTVWRDYQRKAQLAYYSRPYQPQFKVERAQTMAQPGLFAAQARCTSKGASDHSQWLVRGQLFDVSGQTPRELWNSQKPPLSVSYLGNTPGGFGFDSNVRIQETTFGWRFSRDPKDKRALKLVIEAVAKPIVIPESQFGSSNLSVKEATPAQIAAAKQTPNAHYFRESIELKPSDDFKYQTQ